MPRSRVFRFLLLSLAALLVLAATHRLWMPALGYGLIDAQPPAPADAVLVLAGDFYGHRILKAAEMVRAGYVPKALVSGPARMYGNYECDLAIGFAVRRGCREEWFVRLPHEALSTEQEAAALLPGIRRMGVKRLAVVTSDYHTARSRRVFRAMAPDLDVRMVAAPDEFFRPDSWWKDRQARKTVFLEWTKTLAYSLGM